jgi:hypothetical protein
MAVIVDEQVVVLSGLDVTFLDQLLQVERRAVHRNLASR